MNPEVFSYDGEGIQCVYDNQKWVCCIKNYKPNNDIKNIEFLEVHFKTDEQFILLQGKAVLICARSAGDHFEDITLTPMEPLKVYNVPKNVWFNTLTQQDTKLVYVQDAGTCAAPDNSIYQNLTAAEKEDLKKNAAAFL